MKRSYGVTHGIALCDTCGWNTESYKNAQALASKHARHYGHRVEGEIASSYVYDATDDGSEFIYCPKREQPHEADDGGD